MRLFSILENIPPSNMRLEGKIVILLIFGLVIWSFIEFYRAFRSLKNEGEKLHNIQHLLFPVVSSYTKVLDHLQRTEKSVTRDLLLTAMHTGVMDIDSTPLDRAVAVPSFLTGIFVFLGLLGTVWGIAMAIGDLGGIQQHSPLSSTASAKALESLDTIREVITNKLLPGLTSASLCTLAGIIATIISAVGLAWHRYDGEGHLYNVRKYFVETLQALYQNEQRQKGDLAAQAIVLGEKIDNFGQIIVEFEKGVPKLVEIQNGIAVQLQKSASNLTGAFESVGKQYTQLQQQYQTLQDLNTKLADSITSISELVNKLPFDTITHFAGTAEQLAATVVNLQGIVTSLKEERVSVIAQISKERDELFSSVTTERDEFISILKEERENIITSLANDLQVVLIELKDDRKYNVSELSRLMEAINNSLKDLDTTINGAYDAQESQLQLVGRQVADIAKDMAKVLSEYQLALVDVISVAESDGGKKMLEQLNGLLTTLQTSVNDQSSSLLVHSQELKKEIFNLSATINFAQDKLTAGIDKQEPALQQLINLIQDMKGIPNITPVSVNSLDRLEKGITSITSSIEAVNSSVCANKDSIKSVLMAIEDTVRANKDSISSVERAIETVNKSIRDKEGIESIISAIEKVERPSRTNNDSAIKNLSWWERLFLRR